jgi:hypothetical protein
MPITRMPWALMAQRTTPRITAFNAGASPPPLTTAIVLILLMIYRLSLPMIVPESVLAARTAGAAFAFLLKFSRIRIH